MSGPVVNPQAHAQQTVAIRTIVPMDELDLGALCDEYFTRLSSYLEERSIPPSGPFYARYREFGPERADVEIGLPTDGDVTELGELAADTVLGISELPGGTLVEYVHEGPYPELGAAYQSIEQYVASHLLNVAGAPWESYLVMPDMVDGDASRLVTRLSWPVVAG